MNGTIPPLPQYAFMAWCSAKAQGKLCLYDTSIVMGCDDEEKEIMNTEQQLTPSPPLPRHDHISQSTIHN